MSYRNNGSGGYYTKQTAAYSSQTPRYSSMRQGANNGDMRPSMNQNRNSQLFMGDLDPNWDENTIREIWKSLGEGNVDIKMMWNNRNGSRTHMGFCFVQFPSQAHASNALLKNGVQIPNHAPKTLRLNWSSSSNNSNQDSGEISIFVGDLAPNVTETDLFEVFIANYPSTTHAKVVYDQVTGVSKGYAFVKFSNREDQQRALQEMTGTYVKGRAIRVGSAGHQNQRNRNGPQTDIKTRKYNGAVWSSKPSKDSSTSAPQFIFATQQMPPLNCFTDPNNTTICVKKLSSLVSENELRASLRAFGQLVYVAVFPEERCGIAQYVNRTAAEAALRKLQGFRIRDSKIIVSWGKPLRQFDNPSSQYELHPSLKDNTFGYLPLSGGLNSAGVRYDLKLDETISEDDFMLLPGLSSFQYTQFPATASGIQNVYEQNPSGTTNSGPQVILQNSDSFINSKQVGMDSIENGSNGYLFA